MSKHVLIAMAWPYANGSLHLGHVAGLLPSDILARYYRLKGDKVLFVTGSDCHGTPICYKAQEQNKTPQEIADFYHQEFKDSFAKLSFSFDLYGQTTSEEHKKIVQKLFLNLYEENLIYEKEEQQFYCPKCQKFLPDRYIEGQCPKCNSSNARGDQCDDCGALLDPQDLINPQCKLCGTAPELKPTKHLYLKLSAIEKDLKKWLEHTTYWRTNALNFTQQFLAQGLKDRAITRDIDWGVEVPIQGYENKRIYVWFEAVSGYFSMSQIWAKQQGDEDLWKKWWQNKNSFHCYIHGKDNIPFHTIIWPAILMPQKFNLPNQIISSEYLSLEGKQFSTSRNWAVWLPDYLAKYPADALRYYLSINGPENHDADFSWENFTQRFNSELVNNYGNFVHRTLSLIGKYFDHHLPEVKKMSDNSKDLLKNCQKVFEQAGQFLEQGEIMKAIKTIMDLAQQGNQYIDQQAPWRESDENKKAECLSTCAQLIYNLSILFYPFIPQTSEKLHDLLNIQSDQVTWQYSELEAGKNFDKSVPLFEKIDAELVQEEKEKLG
ncbi:MAG: methionine--tRNA ligase [Patescibacteria group bacterium]|nr:methionine--tRNA ligase [Patescibacteria group bacterium]